MHEKSEYDMQTMLCARSHRDFVTLYCFKVIILKLLGSQVCLAVLLVLLESNYYGVIKYPLYVSYFLIV